jgi:hypothetical protein
LDVAEIRSVVGQQFSFLAASYQLPAAGKIKTKSGGGMKHIERMGLFGSVRARRLFFWFWLEASS